MADNGDEQDDIIRLFDMEQKRVFSCSMSDVITIDDVSDDEDTELNATSGSTKSISTVLSAAFYDIETNVTFLEQCRPLSIKLVDCNKFPHYFDKSTKSNEDIHQNSKIPLESNCIDISSSDENDAYDIIVERKVSKDIADINKEFDKARFISALDNKSNNSQTISSSHDINLRLEDKNRNCDRVLEGYNTRDLKVNDNIWLSENQNKSKCWVNKQGLIQENKEKSCEVTGQNKNEVSKPCKGRKNLQFFSQYGIEETYIDKIDTYARLIEKSYTNLQINKTRNKAYDIVKHCNGQYKIQPKSHVTNKPDVKSETSNDKLKKYANNFMTVKNNIAPLVRNLKYEDDENVSVDKSVNNNVKQFLNTKTDSDADMKLYSDCRKEAKCTTDEVSQNIGSRSPILPCPTHINKSIDLNIKNIAPVAPQYLFTKQTIEKECKKGVCTNQFYSANRIIPHYHNKIIPHYHNKIMRRAKIVQPLNVCKNVSEKSTKVENMQINNENVLCKENDYIKDKRQLKQNELVDVKFKDFIEISLNPITSANDVVPIKNVNNSTLYNSKQEPYKFNKCKESLGRGVSMQYNSVISTVTNNESKYNFPESNKIPDHKSQHTFCNGTMSAFPVQSIIPNQGGDDFRSNDFSISSNDYMALFKPILNRNDVYPYYVNNNFCNTVSDLNCTRMLQTPHDFNEYKQLCENRQALVKTNELSQHQIRNSPILNPPINNHYVNDIKNTLPVNNGNTYMPKFHDHLLGTRNIYQRKRKTTYPSDDKYSTLKKHLDRAQLKLSSSSQDESIVKNKKSYQRIDKSNINKSQLVQQNKNTTVANKNTTLISDSSVNTDEEKVIAALVATDCMTENTLRKEENINHKRKYITQSLNRLLQGVDVSGTKNTASDYLGERDNSHTFSLMSSDHSSTLYLKPKQQKGFKLLGKIKVYDLEGSKQIESLRRSTEESKKPVSLKKGKLNNKGSLLRKISINEYRQRQSPVKNENYENKKYNL